MKKFLLPGILTAFALFLPSRSQANPLDVPYQILVDTTASTSVTLSTTNFPSLVPSVNSNVANYAWCLSHVVVSGNGSANSTFTIAWSSTTSSSASTDYSVVVPTATIYNQTWEYRTPYCAPVGWPIVKLNTTGSGVSITAEGYLWKGWNP